jgi:hypothetical protein
MENIWHMDERKIWIEPFLIYAISLLILVSAALIIALIAVRYIKIKETQSIGRYAYLIEEMMLKVLFDNGSFIDFEGDPAYAPLLKKKLFRDRLMAALMDLHLNDEGRSTKRLEAFYLESHLITDSFRKLKDRHWETNCQAIEELSEMKVTSVFDQLVEKSKSPNQMLKIAAIKGCIKLNGTNGLTHLARHTHPLDLWTQISIINALKQGDIEHAEGIDLLLNSKNHTVVSLGLKIIQTLQLSQYTVDIIRTMNTTDSKAVKLEAQEVLAKVKVHIPMAV